MAASQPVSKTASKIPPKSTPEKPPQRGGERPQRTQQTTAQRFQKTVSEGLNKFTSKANQLGKSLNTPTMMGMVGAGAYVAPRLAKVNPYVAAAVGIGAAGVYLLNQRGQQSKPLRDPSTVFQSNDGSKTPKNADRVSEEEATTTSGSASVSNRNEEKTSLRDIESEAYDTGPYGEGDKPKVPEPGTK
jgi:hypothetical protein